MQLLNKPFSSPSVWFHRFARSLCQSSGRWLRAMPLYRYCEKHAGPKVESALWFVSIVSYDIKNNLRMHIAIVCICLNILFRSGVKCFVIVEITCWFCSSVENFFFFHEQTRRMTFFTFRSLSLVHITRLSELARCAVWMSGALGVHPTHRRRERSHNMIPSIGAWPTALPAIFNWNTEKSDTSTYHNISTLNLVLYLVSSS